MFFASNANGQECQVENFQNVQCSLENEMDFGNQQSLTKYTSLGTGSYQKEDINLDQIVEDAISGLTGSGINMCGLMSYLRCLADETESQAFYNRISCINLTKITNKIQKKFHIGLWASDYHIVEIDGLSPELSCFNKFSIIDPVFVGEPPTGVELILVNAPGYISDSASSGHLDLKIFPYNSYHGNFHTGIIDYLHDTTKLQ